MNKYEDAQKCIDNCIAEGENTRKYFKNIYNEYLKAQKQLVKFSECINVFKKVDDSSHPQISGAVSKNSEELYTKVEELSKFIEVNLGSTKSYMDKYVVNDFNKYKNDLQSKMAELYSDNEKFVSKMSDVDQTTSKMDFQNGFDKHCDYILFIRNLTDKESEIIKLLTDIKTMIKEANDFLATMRKTINVSASTSFPVLSSDFKVLMDEGYQTKILNEIEKLKKLFNKYREPKICLQELYTFNNNSQMRMLAKNNITDENGTIVFKENDIVKVLDSSYWEVEVKKVNEQNVETSKMFVKVEDLKPNVKV